jgi:hypothetical protein
MIAALALKKENDGGLAKRRLIAFIAVLLLAGTKERLACRMVRHGRRSLGRRLNVHNLNRADSVLLWDAPDRHKSAN